MIKNLWKDITLYCNCHKEKVLMQPNPKGSSLFYSCPRYYSENRSPDEKACCNRISLNDYQAAVEHIGERLAKNEAENVVENLTGHTWSRKGIQHTVISHEDGNIKIAVKNLTALR